MRGSYQRLAISVQLIDFLHNSETVNFLIRNLEQMTTDC